MTFVPLEDTSLKTAQSASYIALAVGIAILTLVSVHTIFEKIPGNNIMVSVFTMLLELCLLEVYTAQNNGVCKVEGCSWGTAVVWLVTSQLAFAAASLGSWNTSKIAASSGDMCKWSSRSIYKNNTETLRCSNRKIDI